MLFFCAVGMTMIIYSPYILSNAQIGLLACAVFDIQLKPFKVRLHPKLLENWFAFWKNPVFWAPSVLFIMVLVGALYSTDIFYGFERFVLKLPFFGLLFAFFCLPRLTERAYHGLFYYLVILLFLTNLGIGAHYLLHFEEVNQALEMGQPIPTPRNHVRYSLLLGLGILSGFVLVYKNFYFRSKAERWMIAGFTIFNFVFIHILSVRSGLAVMYCSLIGWVLILMWTQKKFLFGLLTLAAVASAPVMAYYTIPSFQSKISYANWEWHEFMHGRTSTTSDQGRLRSLDVGYQVFREHPIIGVGVGDLKQEIYKKYDLRYPDTKKIMPHNQFLSVAAGSGIVGLLLFLAAFCYPFLARSHYRNPFFAILFLTFFLSFIVENTLENSIGIGFFCLFLGMGLSYLTGPDSEQNWT